MVQVGLGAGLLLASHCGREPTVRGDNEKWEPYLSARGDLTFRRVPPGGAPGVDGPFFLDAGRLAFWTWTGNGRDELGVVRVGSMGVLPVEWVPVPGDHCSGSWWVGCNGGLVGHSPDLGRGVYWASRGRGKWALRRLALGGAPSSRVTLGQFCLARGELLGIGWSVVARPRGGGSKEVPSLWCLGPSGARLLAPRTDPDTVLVTTALPTWSPDGSWVGFCRAVEPYPQATAGAGWPDRGIPCAVSPEGKQYAQLPEVTDAVRVAVGPGGKRAVVLRKTGTWLGELWLADGWPVGPGPASLSLLDGSVAVPNDRDAGVAWDPSGAMVAYAVWKQAGASGYVQRLRIRSPQPPTTAREAPASLPVSTPPKGAPRASTHAGTPER